MEKDGITLLSESMPSERAGSIVEELTKTTSGDVREFVNLFRQIRKWAETARLPLTNWTVQEIVEKTKEYVEGFGLEAIRAEYAQSLFEAMLRQDANIDAISAVKYAKDTEKSCFEHVVADCKVNDGEVTRHWISKEFENLYKTRCGTVLSNLDPDTDPGSKYSQTLLRKIYDGENVGNMTERELIPEASAEERAELEIRMGQTIVVKESTMYTCPFCFHKRTTYEERQFRSADEAADIVCVCLQCHNRFRA